MSPRLRRALRPALLVLVVALVVGGGYLAWVGVRRNQPLTLPRPDGPYRVGRATFDWTDASRTDPLAPRPGTRRELSVWVWFPAPGFTINAPAPYAPGPWAAMHLAGVQGFFEGSFDAVRGHTLQDATVADGSFPVVVLEPGLGFAAPQYTVLAEGLASHGYLVAGVTPTYSANVTVLDGRTVRSTPAGNPGDLAEGSGAAQRLVDLWAADARFVARSVAALNATGQFGGRVSAGRTAYVGHSLGGAAALQACATDERCGAAVDLDGSAYGSVVRTGVRAPALILGAQSSCVTGSCRPSGADDRAVVAATRSLAAGSSPAVRCATLAGAKHLDFSDYAALYLAAPLRRLLALGDIDGARGLTAQSGYLSAFLDTAVRGRPQRLLDQAATRYPDVHPARSC